MTEIERSLLNMVQHDFPMVSRPYRALGERLGISEEQCIALLQKLTDQGILRDIRPVISWNRIGLSTVLVGVNVTPEYLDEVAGAISEVPGVTHNYSRNGKLNLWFTLIYDVESRKEGLFEQVRAMRGVLDLKEFKSEKIYKIGLLLDV